MLFWSLEDVVKSDNLADDLRDEGLGQVKPGDWISLARQGWMKFHLPSVQHVLQHVKAQTTLLEDTSGVIVSPDGAFSWVAFYKFQRKMRADFVCTVVRSDNIF